jgi:uncharacterized membrane protein
MADEFRTARPPIVPLLHIVFGLFAFAFFIAALIADIVFANSGNLAWQYFSIWLITGGMIMGGFALLFALIDTFRGGSWRRRNLWPLGLSILAWLLGLLDAFVHSRDGWTAVVPGGLILTALVVVILCIVLFASAYVPARSSAGAAL